MQNNNLTLVSGGLLMAVGLNEIYTLIAIIAIAIGVLSTAITLIVKFVKFIKDGKLTREEQQELIDESKKLTDELTKARTEIEELKKKNNLNKES